MAEAERMDAPRTYRILRRAALHFAVAAWVASAAGAESPAALRTLLDSAMRNNPSIRAARARWEADEARVPQAGSLNDPQFRAMLMNSTGTPAMSLTPNDIQYRISLDVPFPGKRALRADMAREDAAISRHDIRRLELDIAQRIKDAYFDIHLAERKIEVNARNTERVRELLAAVRERYGTGRAELSDVLDLQNELAIRVNNESSFRDERRGAEIRLNLLRDMSAS
ncbi:TolC family protein, partial [Candidatus Poribacteria bacterium]|nr:TolC family protein [Candidatus Poribacteria bacterium]